jgi:hypothetical protein
MSEPSNIKRQLIHSFPRPKVGENDDATLERALAILKLIRDVGLVLAPEVLEWDLQQLTPGRGPLRIFQQRLCLTELSPTDLPAHSHVFGPLALSFDVARLRDAGAMPVIYVPQGVGSPLSQIGTFCVNGAHHTKYVLGQLQQLKELSDPASAANTFGIPVAPNYALNLQNTDASGHVVAAYSVPAVQVQNILQHVGFNNIPFDHSIGVLAVFLNMFCPTDNLHLGEPLGYYRQREWRLIASDIRINGRPLGRDLSDVEKETLAAVDPLFWNHPLLVDGNNVPRRDLAVVYEPLVGWSALDLIESIYAPVNALPHVKKIVGEAVPVHQLV